MPIKYYNPTSPGRRAGSVLDYKAEITKFEPEKSLCVGRIRASGRNHHGVITAKHHGGGNKRLYRIIDFKRNSKDGMPANVEAIEYDPNRSVNIALIKYEDGDEGVYPVPNGTEGGHEGGQRRRFPAGAGQLHAAVEHSRPAWRYTI